jgi:hypothetical protein
LDWRRRLRRSTFSANKHHRIDQEMADKKTVKDLLEDEIKDLYSAFRYQEGRDFLHSFQSPIVAAAMSLTAVRSHLPERLFRSATIRAAALAVPR